jgi:peptide subunit release factor RF-3
MTTTTTRDRWRDEPHDRPASERAQPGDVLGIEHDGETTELGDTAEDEDERLEDAEDDLRRNR